MHGSPAAVSCDPSSTNHRQAAFIQQPISLHPGIAQPQQQPAVILTSSANATQLPFAVDGHQLPVAISTIPLPPPMIGQPINGPPNYTLASGLQPHFGSHSGYGINRNPEENWINGQRASF